MQGVRVTRPLRTILDLLQTGHVDRSLIRQAIDESDAARAHHRETD